MKSAANINYEICRKVNKLRRNYEIRSTIYLRPRALREGVVAPCALMYIFVKYVHVREIGNSSSQWLDETSNLSD